MSWARLKTVLSEMPALRHSVPGEKFDITHSEVVQWLARQPAALEVLFDGCAHYLRYDEATGLWRGRAYAAPGQEPAPGPKKRGRPFQLDRDEIYAAVTKLAPANFAKIRRTLQPRFLMSETAVFLMLKEFVREGRLTKVGLIYHNAPEI